MQSTHSHAIPTHMNIRVSREAGRRERPTLKRQRGMTTLVVALVLLIALTILTFSVAKVSGLEQRIAANDVRTLAAHEAAQAGIEQAIAYLNANLPLIDSDAADGWRSGSRWARCTAAETALPCGDGQSNQYNHSDINDAWLRYTVPNQISLPGSPYITTVYYLTKNTPAAAAVVGAVDVQPQPRIIIIASATPNADPLAGSAVIQQITQYFSLVNMPPTTLSALGQIGLMGNIGVYGNPTPAASFYPPLQEGRPLSVWSASLVTVDGSAQTCLHGSDCGSGSTNGIPHKLTDKTTNGGDIADNHAGFPADPFQYIFGVPNAASASIKAQSTVLSSCSDLTSASSGLFWVTGDCSVVNNIGSATAPAIILVEGDFKMNSTHHLYGLVYSKGSGSVSLTGGPILWGGIIADHAISIGAGSYTMRYLDLSTIPGNNTGGFAKVPGGWLDTYKKPVS